MADGRPLDDRRVPLSVMQNQQSETAEERKLDIFRDTPLRYLGYANEVGEAFRQLVPVSVVRLSYAVASAYCFSDATSKAIDVKKDHAHNPNKNRIATETFIEAVVWQGLASVIIPGFTINRLCWMSGNILRARSTLSSARQKALVTTIGLAAVPLIIKPIDRLVDNMMDSAIDLSRRLGVKHEISHEEKFSVSQH